MKKLVSVLLVIALMFTMVIPAVAEGETYTVTFYNTDGNVISAQEGVALGDSINYPEDSGKYCDRYGDYVWSTSETEVIYAPDTLEAAEDLSVYYLHTSVQSFEATTRENNGHWGLTKLFGSAAVPSLTIATDKAYTGKKSVKFTNGDSVGFSQADGNWGYRQFSHIGFGDIAANTAYRITYKYYVPAGNTSDIIINLYAGAQGNPSAQASYIELNSDFTVSATGTTGEWVEASYSFAVPATVTSHSLNMWIYPKSKSRTDTAVIYIDDISVEKVYSVTYNYIDGYTFNASTQGVKPFTMAYATGETIKFPTLDNDGAYYREQSLYPGNYQDQPDYLWSLSKDELITLDNKTMGSENINLYQYAIPGVYGAENMPGYAIDFWGDYQKGVKYSSEVVYSGYQSYKFENSSDITAFTPSGWGNRAGNQILLRRISSNTTYRISFKYYAAAGNTDTVTLTPATEHYNNPSNADGVRYSSVVLDNAVTNQWRDCSFTITTGTLGANLDRLVLILLPTSKTNTTKAVFYIDNVIFETVTGETTFVVGDDANVSGATVTDGKVTLDYWQYTGVTPPAVTYDNKEVIGWAATEGSTEAVEVFEAGATYYPITKEIFTVTFDYGNGTVEKVVYNEGDAIEYPKLSATLGKDVVWSKSADSFVAVDATMGKESVTVYKYTRNIVGFENYTGAHITLANRFQVTDEKAFSGNKSIKFVNELYGLLTAEPSDWSTSYTSYYTLTDGNYTKVTGDTAPEFALNTYYVAKLGVAEATNNISLGQVVNAGKTYKISYKYYVEAGNTGNFTVTAYVGGVNAWNATGGCAWTTTGYNRTYTPGEADGQWHTTEMYVNALPDAVTGKAYLYLHGKNSNNSNTQTTVVYIDDITVEETVAVTLDRNGVTTTVYGVPGEALPETGIIDKNWYTDEAATKLSDNVFPGTSTTLFSAAKIMSGAVENGELYFGSAFDAVDADKDGSTVHSLKYESLGAVSDQSVMYRLGKVKNNTTYKVTFSYKSTGDFGFNFASANVDNAYINTSPVEGDVSYSLISVNPTDEEWNIATAIFTVYLRGVMTETADDDTLVSSSDWLYMYLLDGMGTGEIYIADISVKEMGIAVNAEGASILTDEAAATADTQAIRYFFDYETEDGNVIIIGGERYNVVARGFIYTNGSILKYADANSVNKAGLNLKSTRTDKVITSKKSDFDTCWAQTERGITFSTYITGFTEEYSSNKLMVRAYITILVDGKEMNIYSATVNRSVNSISIK